VARLGRQLQLRLTNEAGTTPLVVGAVSIGGADAGLAVRPGTLVKVTFGSHPGIAIPTSAPVVSDPITTEFGSAADLIVSVYLPEPTLQAQGQSSIYVDAPRPAATVVALGDSITDAAMSTSQEVRGWPGQLALRLAKAAGPVRYGVSNQGIGGNRLLLDGIGANALAR